mmetsp:Transcript_34355/g.83390  ORF Transcript_34355/g.83390 Transcript_34355/m.83390 type:complete len:111 (+) Transcript_34355:1104-1436(+)
MKRPFSCTKAMDTGCLNDSTTTTRTRNWKMASRCKKCFLTTIQEEEEEEVATAVRKAESPCHSKCLYAGHRKNLILSRSGESRDEMNKEKVDGFLRNPNQNVGLGEGKKR